MSFTLRLRPVLWIAFFTALVAIVYLTLRPGNHGTLFMWSDKIQHAGAYVMLSFLAGLASRQWRQAALMAAGLAAMGYGLELIQPYFGRSYDLLDEAANITGCLAGFIASQTIKQIIKQVTRI